MPTLLTPGAAEALVVKAYRHARTQNVAGGAALEASLVGYQNPVPGDVLEFQMRIAIREATDLELRAAGVPGAWRSVKDKPSYLAAAFNARPFGMPIPPNWFGLATFGFLGAFINPGLWLIGARASRASTCGGCRRTSASATPSMPRPASPTAPRATKTCSRISIRPAQSQQYEIEQEAAEIVALLQRSEAHGSQIGDVRQMAWLHLKLLAARASFAEVVAVADRERKKLDEQERRCRERLAAPDTDEELRRSLEQQTRSHPVAPRRARRCRAPHGTGGRRTRPPAPAGVAGARAGAARDRRRQHGAVARCAVGVAERSESLAQGSARVVRGPRQSDEPPPADLLVQKRAVKRAAKVSE